MEKWKHRTVMIMKIRYLQGRKARKPIEIYERIKITTQGIKNPHGKMLVVDWS